MFCGECGRSTGARPAPSSPVPTPQPVEVEVPVEPDPAPEIEPQAEPEAIPEAEPEFETPVEPEVERDVQPESDPESVVELVIAPAPDAPDASDAPDAPGASRASDNCTQCGQRFEPSDIFCAECGFVRPRSSAVPRPQDTVAYDPFPWGLTRDAEHTPARHPELDVGTGRQPLVDAIEPAGGPLPAPIVASIPPSFPPAEEEEFADVEETRIVTSSSRRDRFVLQFSTGESVTVFGSGMVGRHPLAEPGEYFDTFVTIVDPGKSVSKTHVEFGQESGGFWVSDRFSGNGTVVREPDAQPRRCEPGKRYRIARGTRVEIGEQFFIVS
jgi:hypothetical protein